jgi:hypothetical protein
VTERALNQRDDAHDDERNAYRLHHSIIIAQNGRQEALSAIVIHEPESVDAGLLRSHTRATE